MFNHVRSAVSRLYAGLLLLALHAVPSIAFAQANPVNWSTTSAGLQTLVANPTLTTVGPFGPAANAPVYTSPAGGGAVVTQTGSPPLASGAKPVVTFISKVPGTALLAGAATFAGTYGMAALFAWQVWQAWTNGTGIVQNQDPATNGAKPFLMPDPSVCTASPCYVYSVSGWSQSTSTSAMGACGLAAQQATAASSSDNYSCVGVVDATVTLRWVRRANSSITGTQTYGLIQSTTPPASSEPTYPASWNDIGPYLTQRPPPTNIVPEMLNLGIPLQSEAQTATGPASVVAPNPKVQTDEVPATTSGPTITILPGNPYSIPAGTTTPWPVSTSTTMVQATSPSGMIYPQPRTGVGTATYDPQTNQTTLTETHTTPKMKIERTQTTTTSITYGPGQAVGKDNTTGTVTATNIDSGQVVTTTTTTTTTDAAPDTDPCEASPDRVGCSTLGTAPTTETLKRLPNYAMTVTATAFAGAGACPAPLSFTVVGHSYAVSYQALCDKLLALKVLFLAMAAVMAAWIISDSFKV